MNCAISDIGKRIIELRATHNLTQEQLAKALNVSREVVGKWETGTRDLKTGHTIALANYFQISCDELLRGIKADHVNINEATGLSSDAIEKIKNSINQHTRLIQMFNAMITGNGFDELLDCIYLAVQKKNEVADWGKHSKEQNVHRMFTPPLIEMRIEHFREFNPEYVDKSDNEVIPFAMDMLNKEIIDKLREESDMLTYKANRLFDKLFEKMITSQVDSIQKKNSQNRIL
jgi:transcriptional regulator with XRE-family HTH domain